MKKVLFGLVAIVMCMSAVMFTSCSADSKLKASVEEANKGLPKESQGITLNKVEYDENSKTVTYEMELSEQVGPIFKAQYDANPDQYKAFYLYNIKDDASYKSLAELLVKAKGSLKFVFTIKGSSDKIELAFSTDDLQKLVDGKLEKVDAPQPAQQAAPAEAGAEEQAAPAEEATGEEAAGEEATGEEATGEEGGEYAE